MAELFGRKQVVPKKPITADMCSILWLADSNSASTTDPAADGSGAISSATNISIQYQQQVVRRRTLGAANGSPIAVIYPSQPVGSMAIQRLICETNEDIFQRAGWNICKGTAVLTISFDGATAYEGCNTTGSVYIATGATVTGYSISAEAEGLTVVDSIEIQFLQLEAQHRVGASA